MEHLKRRLGRAETEAFVELYDLLGDRLMRYLAARLNSDDARDVLQEVFTRLVRYHRRLGRSKNLQAYVFLTARNEANRWLRKKNRMSTTESVGNDFEPIGKESPISHQIEQVELASKLLDELSIESREIVELKIYSELTFAEIAEILSLPAGTAATKYRRAILKMQSKINQTDLHAELAPRENP